MTMAVDNLSLAPTRPASWIFSRSARQYSHALTLLLIAPLMLLYQRERSVTLFEVSKSVEF
ncbi:hypothetical protein [Rhizobium ruizarguesonis]|uniref:hypothetical protein n=1 Tax=Rhizobium ruizarguesonis TaxID=2081791 RepID=UPI00371EB044